MRYLLIGLVLLAGCSHVHKEYGCIDVPMMKSCDYCATPGYTTKCKNKIIYWWQKWYK